MSDEPAQPATFQERSRSRLRWKSLVFILVLGAVCGLVFWSLAQDRTSGVIAIYRCSGLTLLALLGWWCCLSGVSLRARLAGLLLVGAAAGSSVLAIRSVEFTGDMVPRFHWRWEPSASERSAEWLRQHAPAANSSAVLPEESLVITTADWPRYCGFDGSRIIREPRPETDWDANPPRELWRHPVGEAWSSFAVVGERLFTQEQRGSQECVTCYHADTGAELWRHEDSARFDTAMGGIGPRATPTVSENALYALGATGILNCLHPVTGKQLWQRNILDDAGAKILDWAMSGSPLLYQDLVIVDAGGQQGRAVIAYHRDSGQIAWATASHVAGYAAPRLEDIAGRQTLVIFHGEGLLGLVPETGKSLWEYPFTNMYNINVAQPIRFADQMFISNGYDGGCVLLDPTRLTGQRPAEVWPPNNQLKLKFNEAVARDGFVYGLDDGILACLDVATGERRWKGGRYRHGQVLLWDDLLLVQAEPGYVALVKAEPDRFTEISRFEALSDRADGLVVKAWNVPVVNRGRLFIRDAYEMACYDLNPQ